MGLFSTVGGAVGSVFGGPVGGAVGMGIGGLLDAEGSRRAGAAGSAASMAGVRESRRQYDLARQDSAPWRKAGALALGEYQTGVQDLKDFQFSFDSNIADESYDFRFEEGRRAADRAFARGGKTISGARAIGLQEYGQNFASQEYQKEYERQLNTARTNYGFRSDHLNRLASMSGLGLNAAQQLGAQGANSAQTVSQGMQAAGGYQAAGIMGRYNTLGNVAGDIARIGGQAGWFGGGNTNSTDTSGVWT